MNTERKYKFSLNFGYYSYASFVLVMLKVGGMLDWSWGWVLAPVFVLMSPVAIGACLASLAAVALVFFGALAVLVDILDRR